MSDKRDSKFGAGLLIGALLGSAAALFLSPKTGKDNRKLLSKKIKEFQSSIDDSDIKEQVQKIFGEVSEDGMKLYKKARKDLTKRLDELKDKIEDFDHDKYISMVDDVIEDTKEHVDASSKHIDSLKNYLLENWNTLSGQVEEKKADIKKSKKKN